MTGGSLSINTANPTVNLPSTCAPATFTTSCFANSSAGAAFAYTRSGSWNLTGGTVALNHVMHYEASGFLKMASADPPTWLAPTQGPFLGLSFWSELSSNRFSITGGSGMNLSGLFFTPEAAPFSLAGGGTWGQQSAQFISYQLAISGGSTAAFVPDPTTAFTIPPTAGFLIR
jgi:hypothetical protein